MACPIMCNMSPLLSFYLGRSQEQPRRVKREYFSATAPFYAAAA
jgi:hypothetical protein